MFQIRRAIARVLTQTPIRASSKQIIQCQVRRSIGVQVQATRAFSQVRSYRAEETEKAVPIEHEAVEGSDSAIQEHASATAESTDTVSDSLEPAQQTQETQPESQAPQPDQARLFVANLNFDITEADLQEQFGNYGTVRSAVLALDNLGRSRGFAHITFESAADAANAVRELHGREVRGREIAVVISVPRNPTRQRAPRAPSNPPSKTLYIGNLSFKMTDADLNDLFRNIKNVIDVRVAIDRRTGQPRGFAHADFTDVSAAVAAKEVLDSKQFHNRQLRIDFAANTSASERPAPQES